MNGFDIFWWYVGNILDYGLQMLPCIILGVIGFLAVYPLRKRKLLDQNLVSSRLREIFLLLFVSFCAGLASVTLFPANFWSADHWNSVFCGVESLFPEIDFQNQMATLQLNPFQEILRAFRGPWVMFLMIANIGIFLPIGFFPALLWRNIQWWKSVSIGFFTSVFIESIQFFIGRSTDVDDVILNTAGSLIGFWLYCLIRLLFPQLSDQFQCSTKESP